MSLRRCLDAIEERQDLVSSARCIVEARHQFLNEKSVHRFSMLNSVNKIAAHNQMPLSFVQEQGDSDLVDNSSNKSNTRRGSASESIAQKPTVSESIPTISFDEWLIRPSWNEKNTKNDQNNIYQIGLLPEKGEKEQPKIDGFAEQFVTDNSLKHISKPNGRPKSDENFAKFNNTKQLTPLSFDFDTRQNLTEIKEGKDKHKFIPMRLFSRHQNGHSVSENKMMGKYKSIFYLNVIE